MFFPRLILLTGSLTLIFLILLIFAPQTHGAAAESRALTGQEALALARVFLEQAGRPAEPGERGEPEEQGERDQEDRAALAEKAEQIYTLLLRHTEEEIRIEAAFQLAQIRLAQRRFRQAASLFQEILNQKPDLPRVRLDLARAYFLDGNYNDARFQFELVRGGDLPPAVLANIDAFLDAIRRKKDWNFDFSLGIMPDSNVNQASGTKEECIDTAFGTLCRPLETRSSGLGVSANGSADYFARVSQDWGLRGTIGFNVLKYEETIYDDHTLSVALGPRFLWENGEASLQPFFRRRWIAGKTYNQERGLRLDLSQGYGRLLLSESAAFGFTRYDDAYVHSVLRGNSWNIRLRPRYILDDRSFVQAGLEFMRENTQVRAYTYDGWRYSLGAYHAFSHGFALFLEGSLTRTKYKDSRWYVTRDNRIDENIRQDNTWQFYASLSSSLLESLGLTPMLQYIYTKRLSNVWTKEYERNRLNLTCGVRF